MVFESASGLVWSLSASGLVWSLSASGLVWSLSLLVDWYGL